MMREIKIWAGLISSLFVAGITGLNADMSSYYCVRESGGEWRMGNGKERVFVSNPLEIHNYTERFDTLLDEVGIERKIRVLDGEGKPCSGIEVRTAEYKGRTIMYLINWEDERRCIQLKSEIPIKSIRNVIREEEFKSNFNLNPFDVVLLLIGFE